MHLGKISWNLHTKKADVSRNTNMPGFWTCGNTNGATGHRQNYQQLQTTDERPHETWQTVFGKDFGSMAQSNHKTGQQGTNSIFVMTQDKIFRIPKRQSITYACIVVDFCPQKMDPHHIWITAGGNLIKYPGKLLTRTADLTTSKLIWNSVLIKDAWYMWMDIKNLYLSAPIDRNKCIWMLFALFPEWIWTQYILDNLELNGFIYLEMHCTVWGLPQSGIWQASCCKSVCSLMDISNVQTPPACGNMPHTPSCSHWLWTALG